ncbi:hypothetical protein POM88_055026 [Heracleum sosnowskyi]|uniref:Uncharacterized protein n=1 Tax=Heracleum sosnowskyi TaxID=360622 RepID=A0AAD8GLV1_9APIA|nr:hypothetical protein POM88_055026 [Heracleum sosnowskyi]
MNYNFLYYKIWCDFQQLHRFSSTSGCYILPSKRFKLPGASIYAHAKYDVEVTSEKSYNGCSARTVLNGAKCQAMLFSHLGGPALKTYGILNVPAVQRVKEKLLCSLGNLPPLTQTARWEYGFVLAHC